MRTPLVIVAVSTFALLAGCADNQCGALDPYCRNNDSPPVVTDGEPLMNSTLTGEASGVAFTPAYGFVYEPGDGMHFAISDAKINCFSRVSSAPGTYVDATAYSADATGLYQGAHFDFTTTSGTLKSDDGVIEITAVSEGEVTATLAYDVTASNTGERFSLSGTVTIVRCTN